MEKRTFGIVLFLVALAATVHYVPEESASPTLPPAATPLVPLRQTLSAPTLEFVAEKSPAPRSRVNGTGERSAAPDRTREGTWTEARLAGTRWKGTSFDFSFAEDGTWYMAGRAASKWQVEGDRIKLFDDRGEVHYIEIDGDTLKYNGESIGQPIAN